MRNWTCLFVALGLLTTSPGWADEPEEEPWSFEKEWGQETLRPWAWGVGVGAGATAVVLASWGLGTALADLDSSSGPPVAVTVSALAWSTLLMAAAGLALDYALSSPPSPSGPE